MAERVVQIARPGLVWAAGAPEPVLMAGEARTLFAFYRLEGPLPEDEVQAAEFVGCTSVRFGFPNDEALHGHPLWGRGLTFYGLHEVQESSWLDEVRSIEKAHPKASSTPFPGTRHFILTFHDSTLEALAQDVIALDTYQSLGEAVTALGDLLRGA